MLRGFTQIQVFVVLIILTCIICFLSWYNRSIRLAKVSSTATSCTYMLKQHVHLVFLKPHYLHQGSPFLSTVSDGVGDAFRHALWNYRMTQIIGKSEAKKFGDAHEEGNFFLTGYSGGNNAASKAMDLYNNNVGRNLRPIPGSKFLIQSKPLHQPPYSCDHIINH